MGKKKKYEYKGKEFDKDFFEAKTLGDQTASAPDVHKREAREMYRRHIDKMTVKSDKSNDYIRPEDAINKEIGEDSMENTRLSKKEQEDMKFEKLKKMLKGKK